jgi:hypothetical protein
MGGQAAADVLLTVFGSKFCFAKGTQVLMADEELDPRLLAWLASDAGDVWYRDAKLWGGVACLGIALGSWRLARRRRKQPSHEELVVAALAGTESRNWLLESLDETLIAPAEAVAAAADHLFGSNSCGRQSELAAA